MILGAISQNSYLPLFIVDQCLHVHVSDTRVVGVIVGQRPVVGGKKCQGQCVRGQTMQDSLLCQTIVRMVQSRKPRVVSYPSDRHSIL
jgi:hypothetical protein